MKKRLYPKLRSRRVLSFTWFLLMAMSIPTKALSQTYEIYVGQTYTLPYPTPPTGSIDAIGGSTCSKSDCVGTSGLQVKVHKYFSGSATVSVDYNYSYISSYTKKRVVDHGTAYYTIKCKATKVTLNKTELTLDISDLFEFTYTTEPSGLEPVIEWVSSDEKVAKFPDSRYEPGVLYPEGEGTCTITAKCNSGYENPKCTVTVVDNYWVKADVASGIVEKGTKVTLSCKKAGATIYYTTDGTDPTIYSTKYTSPIELTKSITLKAKAFLGNQESKITTREYEIYAHKEGEVFTAKNEDGVEITYVAFIKYYMYVGESLQLAVGTGSANSPAIDKKYTGHLTIPYKVDGILVTKINEYAFDGCNLSSIEFPTDMNFRIMSYAFRNCRNLTSLDFPHAFILSSRSFEGCENLKSINFQGAITFSSQKDPSISRNVDDEVFYDCKNLKEVYANFWWEPTAIKDHVFYCPTTDIYSTATLFVLQKYIWDYQTTKGWKNFKTIKEIGGTDIRSSILEKAKDAPIYNLNGQRMDKPRKGINIIGGRKVIVK